MEVCGAADPHPQAKAGQQPKPTKPTGGRYRHPRPVKRWALRAVVVAESVTWPSQSAVRPMGLRGVGGWRYSPMVCCYPFAVRDAGPHRCSAPPAGPQS